MKNLFKNSFCTFVITLLLSTTGFSQGGGSKVFGKITSDGEPLIGASIFILELEKHAISQIGGDYILDNIEPQKVMKCKSFHDILRYIGDLKLKYETF